MLNFLKKIARYIRYVPKAYETIYDIKKKQTEDSLCLQQIKELQIDQYLLTNLHAHSKYLNNKKLNRFEKQFFSQNGEDGIIEEIFNRIGTTNKFFVEFGIQDGLECNTAFLLLSDWHGCWIEGDTEFAEQARKNFSAVKSTKLQIHTTFITAENIQNLFTSLHVPEELDLLSIDIDMNDYWVWKAIVKFRPRVVVIEYNSSLPANIKWVVEYDSSNFWKGTTYFNSSLKSLELLGKEKGYSLVGCDFVGANAFFVRNDLLHNHFQEPYTSENHYEAPKFFLRKNRMMNKAFGKYKNI